MGFDQAFKFFLNFWNVFWKSFNFYHSILFFFTSMDNSTELSNVLNNENETYRSNSQLHRCWNSTELCNQIQDIEIWETVNILYKVHSKVSFDRVLFSKITISFYNIIQSLQWNYFFRCILEGYWIAENFFCYFLSDLDLFLSMSVDVDRWDSLKSNPPGGCRENLGRISWACKRRIFFIICYIRCFLSIMNHGFLLDIDVIHIRVIVHLPNLLITVSSMNHHEHLFKLLLRHRFLENWLVQTIFYIIMHVAFWNHCLIFSQLKFVMNNDVSLSSVKVWEQLTIHLVNLLISIESWLNEATLNAVNVRRREESEVHIVIADELVNLIIGEIMFVMIIINGSTRCSQLCIDFIL